MSLLNLAGSSYDFGNVLFAVLQECEHQRRALLPNEAAARLREVARRKLAEIRESYEEVGGTLPYWQALEREVMETALPQYVEAAAEQTRLEENQYDLWRRADPLARVLFALAGLVLGSLMFRTRLIPLEALGLLLGALGLLYPEIKKLVFDFRHSRLLNRLIVQAEKYQSDARIHYVSDAQLEAELTSIRLVKPARREEEGSAPPPPRQRERA